jgi:hypothetical protein
MAIQMTCGDDAVVVGPTIAQGVPDLDCMMNWQEIPMFFVW